MTDIYAQVTPNPNTLKFVVNKPIIDSGSLTFDAATITEDTRANVPVVDQLLAITGVSTVMLGQTFISVTKTADAQWGDIAETVTGTIRATCDNDQALIDPDTLAQLQASQAENQSSGSDDSDIVQKIKHILDDEIRPAVAMDGGDVQFKSFDDDSGVLTLSLQGACSTCPSATFTLKMGIENRLKEDIPEIVSVVQDGVPDLF